ncbi:dUTPase [Planococcus massiliensis]|uniref:dUTPase n=1 Tax=Planococcus massiliensis TaxID=1499687 RepID=A0A098EPC0_9BACL|nr:dUTP diphosphatase [Planococcus massiliensis]CEG23146.1 dUTPase [Planococcus massiliensis]
MNIANLFEIQRKLDAEIEAKHPTAAGEDRLAKRILALQVELGECANEWRGFKFWSTDQKARTIDKKVVYDPNPENTQSAKFVRTNPLLEEYVDCLHFILSIGNGLNFDIQMLEQMVSPKKMKNPVDQFLWTNRGLTNLYEAHRDMTPTSRPHYYLLLFDAIMGLGEMLGFTWNQIEEAYMSKNAINHQRQAEGY